MSLINPELYSFLCNKLTVPLKPNFVEGFAPRAPNEPSPLGIDLGMDSRDIALPMSRSDLMFPCKFCSNFDQILRKLTEEMRMNGLFHHETKK